jgi:hypothetical protein
LPVNVTLVVEEPYDVVVPYWNFTVVEAPFGFTEPLSVTLDSAMLVAESVVAVGAVAVATFCVNEKLTEHAPVTAPVVYVVVLHDPAAHVPPTLVLRV